MLPIISKAKTAIMLALPILFTTLLSSFSVKPGGEGFEIYLDNKLVMQRFGKDINTVQNLQLDQQFANAQLTVKYHHCGRVGKNRIITIKDGQDKTLKEWRFKNVQDAYASMGCNVKDILSLKKTSSTMKLYYSSTELPKGRLLASIVIGANNTAALTTR